MKRLLLTLLACSMFLSAYCYDVSTSIVSVPGQWTVNANTACHYRIFKSDITFNFTFIKSNWTITDHITNSIVKTMTFTHNDPSGTDQSDLLNMSKTGLFDLSIDVSLRVFVDSTGDSVETTHVTDNFSFFRVVPAPIILLYVTPTPLLINKPIQFTANGGAYGSEAYTLTWTFNGADLANSPSLNSHYQYIQSVSNGSNYIPAIPAIKYATSGVKTVTLLATAGTGTPATVSQNYTLYIGSDLFMRDNKLSTPDVGDQINWTWLTNHALTYANLTHSPDLWVEHSNTLITTNPAALDGDVRHKTPTYSSSNMFNNNYVYATVTNRGDQASDGSSDKLHMYWTLARTTEMWSNDWLFNLSTNAYTNGAGNTYPLGSEITIKNYNSLTNGYYYNTLTDPITIPSISAGQKKVFYRAWNVPDPSLYTLSTVSGAHSGQPVICLLARIEETAKTNNGMYNESVPMRTAYEQVPDNNNVVTRNTFISSPWVIITPCQPCPDFRSVRTGGSNLGTVFVNNADNQTRELTMGIIYGGDPGSSNFFNYADLYVVMDADLYNIWNSTGDHSVTGMEAVNGDDGVFKVTDLKNMQIAGLTLQAGEEHMIGLEFDYKDNIPDGTLEDHIFSFGELDPGSGQLTGSPSQYVAHISTDTSTYDSLLSGGGGEAPVKLPASVNNKVATTLGLSSNVYPNPSKDLITLEYYLPEASQVKISIINEIGQEIKVLEPGANRLKGDHRMVTNVQDLSNGVYYCVVESNLGKTVSKLVICR